MDLREKQEELARNPWENGFTGWNLQEESKNSDDLKKIFFRICLRNGNMW